MAVVWAVLIIGAALTNPYLRRKWQEREHRRMWAQRMKEDPRQ